MAFKLYRTRSGPKIETDGQFFVPRELDWNRLINASEPALEHATPCDAPEPEEILAPIDLQEVWAAGVTYKRSREARMDESGKLGADLYWRVYDAARPELFFKSQPHRVVGPGGAIRIRDDATWSVPEPELTLVISSAGAIVGYTIGNDVSSRDIEGENALYLPQAKIYEGGCALGPCILMTSAALLPETRISCSIDRKGKTTFEGATDLSMIKRSFNELVAYLYRELRFPQGCLLMTGTGIVPPGRFTLEHGDVVRISIDGIGVLENFVA